MQKSLGELLLSRLEGLLMELPYTAVAFSEFVPIFKVSWKVKMMMAIIIADSRNKAKNANISHSVFTQMYSAQGNPYRNLVEAPTFGHSDNHAGLQLTDMVCSALLFPIVAELCCLQHMQDKTHCYAQHANLRTRYGATLRQLQYQYRYEGSQGWGGGISLSDPLSNRRAVDLFV